MYRLSIYRVILLSEVEKVFFHDGGFAAIQPSCSTLTLQMSDFALRLSGAPAAEGCTAAAQWSDKQKDVLTCWLVPWLGVG